MPDGTQLPFLALFVLTITWIGPESTVNDGQWQWYFAAAAAACCCCAAAVAKKAKDAEKAKADKERSEKIQKWVDSMTMDDVVWDDDEAKWILIGSQAKNQKTHLQSIKGAAPALLTVPALKKFCVKHQIGNYKNLDKYGMCKLIVGAKKAQNLQNDMYPTEGGADEDAQTKKSSSSKKKKAKKNKATKPTCVKSEGTFYRFLLAFFAQDMRPYVIKLGHQPTKNDLDSHRILHYGIFNKLAKVYNDSEHEDLETLPTHDDFYINSNVANDVPSKFDILTAEDMSDVFHYLNFWYKNRMRRCLRSGSHDMYVNFVRDLPFLFLYWTLQQDGPIEIQNLTMPESPGGRPYRKWVQCQSSKEEGYEKPKTS